MGLLECKIFVKLVEVVVVRGNSSQYSVIINIFEV